MEGILVDKYIKKSTTKYGSLIKLGKTMNDMAEEINNVYIYLSAVLQTDKCVSLGEEGEEARTHENNCYPACTCYLIILGCRIINLQIKQASFAEITATYMMGDRLPTEKKKKRCG